jgi:hypothetical protein
MVGELVINHVKFERLIFLTFSRGDSSHTSQFIAGMDTHPTFSAFSDLVSGSRFNGLRLNVGRLEHLNVSPLIKGGGGDSNLLQQVWLCWTPNLCGGGEGDHGSPRGGL